MTTKELFNKLAEPFDPKEVFWKPGAVAGNRALALAYIDARTVQDRLDEVVGPENWSVAFQPVDGTQGKQVIAILTIYIPGEWRDHITKADAGIGDDVKSACSDALKRAAVQFGIGRYLYRLPQEWCDYKDKRIVKPPKLPYWALPSSHRVSEAEVNGLKQLIERAGSKEETFLTQYKVDSLDQLSKEQLAHATGILNARLAAK